ncbi:hypothetical protein M413DRAFT_375794 [Hebeloma cylindrosporum]|uniref:Uncharacterized protein n=1 Tax=Hebeloma cylindrosporum TaxID=76867 RepID=A0A0C2YT41_HEBCY|nr:hypothetical protein M413DRAFT_375794 [Hebeloma cylindrosporum h7]
MPIERMFAHASNEMPLTAAEDEPFLLRFESNSGEAKVIGHPKIISFKPTGAPWSAAQHLIHDVNGDMVSERGELTKEEEDAILSGNWTIISAISEFPQPLPSRGGYVVQRSNPVVFRALTDNVNPISAAPIRNREASVPSAPSNGSAVVPETPSSSAPSSPVHDSATATPSSLPAHHAEAQQVRSASPATQPVVLAQAAPPSAPSESASPSSDAIANPSSEAATEDRRALELSPSSDANSSSNAPDTSNSENLLVLGLGADDTDDKSSSVHDLALPTPSPLPADRAEEQQLRSPSPPSQAVVLAQAAPPSAPSESASPSSHAIANPSSEAGCDDRRALELSPSSNAHSSSNAPDTSNSGNLLVEQTSSGPRKRGHSSDLGPGADDTDDKSPKRLRGVDGEPRLPTPAVFGPQAGPHRVFGLGGPSSHGHFGANSGNRRPSPPRREFKPMLPYNAKTGRKLRREGAFIEKDFGKLTAWLPNPHPHAYSDDPAHASGRPLKRTGAGYVINTGKRLEWYPRPPPSGYYGRSYRDPSPPPSTTRPNAASLADFLGEGSMSSNAVQPPPSPPSGVPPPVPIPGGVDIDDLELEYVDDPRLVAPPVAAATNAAAPSSSWVRPPTPETPTPASRSRRNNDAAGEGALAPSADTRKRSRDDEEDEEESLRPTSRVRSSAVPLPGPSRLPMLPASPPRLSPAAASLPSSDSSQTAMAVVVQAAPEALPLRRSSRLSRAAKKLRK